ncbi:MAG TPA: hypothetical protein VMW50_02400 [Dehalococcoidia bacterium]|nr:hypothetical protein [Dehalococcoidia bacterium]
MVIEPHQILRIPCDTVYGIQTKDRALVLSISYHRWTPLTNMWLQSTERRSCDESLPQSFLQQAGN